MGNNQSEQIPRVEREPPPPAAVLPVVTLQISLGRLIIKAIDGDIHPNDIIEELNRRFNGMLAAYVANPARFREMLDKTESAISGSFIVRFVEGDGDWWEGDMDIYVDIISLQMVLALLELEGYTVQLGRNDSPLYERAGGCIHEVVKLTNSTRRRSIDVIVSSKKISIYPIVDFWGTHVMNFLTGSAICVAYPDTLNKIGYVIPGRIVDWKIPILLGKYERRGYDFPELQGDMMGKVRYFGDEECVVIPVRRGGSLFCGGRHANTVVWRL
ncbi:hypothetical protein NLI96_g12537 [Meripilus lineatus]|uniref:Uncharacterized protein n=1 Tax=Meripilus lineatus TaxID=2056292 RepID=A0AAD5UUE8_9APHY|nr:hypothetical protein NLI96_g12537 [Physisporinus lineatus]